MKFTEAEIENILYEYKDMVRAKASMYFMLGADQEDLIQEGMIGLFKAAQDYDESKGAGFATFAALCVNRQIVNAIKMANRQKHAPLNTSTSLDKPLPDNETITLGESLVAGDDANPEAALLVAEMTELLLSADSGFFSELERKVISLLMKGYDYKQIAELLEKTPKSVDNAIQRIRQKLKRFFMED